MKKNKNLRILGLFILILLLVAACGAPEPAETEQQEPETAVSTDTETTVEEEPAAEEPAAEEPVTIDFWYVAGSGREGAVDAVVAAFEAEHPNITVEVNAIPFAEFISALQVAYAGDNPPDVALANGIEIQNLAFNGALMPVDDLFDEEDRADFMPDLVDMVSLDGQMYGAPWEQAALALYYNKDYFEAAGIEVPSTLDSAWTWPEYKENVAAVMAQQEAEQGEKVWGLTSFQSPITGAFFTWTIVRSNSEPGSPLWNSISPDFSTVAGYIDTPEAMEAYAFFQSLYTDEMAPRDAVPDAFGNGKAVTHMAIPVIGGVLNANFPDLNWGVMPPPYFKTPLTHTGSFAPVIAAKTDNPEEAKLFTDYFVSREGMLDYHSVTPILPGRVSLQEAIPELQGDGYLAFLFDEAIEQGVARPGGPAHSIFNKVIAVNMMRDIALGGDIEETVAAAIAEAEAQMAQYK